MKVVRCEMETRSIPLKAPFAISYHTTTADDLLVLQIVTDTGHVGVGAGAPSPDVTGETIEASARALDDSFQEWLRDRELIPPAPMCRALAERLPSTPAARAAVDMAIYDLWGKAFDTPVVDLLGRAHLRFPTSMTLGLRTFEESLAEARDFLQMGYTTLKVKCGKDIDHDLELLNRLREEFGRDLGIRVDPNQGYDFETLQEFVRRTAPLNIEFIEQPLPADQLDRQRTLPDTTRDRLCVDENLLDERSMLAMVREPKPAAIGNIKLMKCGGIYAALRMATIADVAGMSLMWGCNIESVAGLAAALHAALACPNTRYLDLDGDYDLLEDIATGGMLLEGGYLQTLNAPGLGVHLID